MTRPIGPMPRPTRERKPARADDERDRRRCRQSSRRSSPRTRRSSSARRRSVPSRTSRRRKARRSLSRDQARASALVAEAISLLDIDPDESLQLALQSAIDGLRRRGWRTRCATGLTKARARVVLPSGSGPVTAIDMSSSGASASAVTSSGHTVGALRASADGTLVLVGGADGEVRVYDLASRPAARPSTARRRSSGRCVLA